MRPEDVIASIDAKIASLNRLYAETKAVLDVLNSVEEGEEIILPVGGGVLARFRWEGKTFMDIGGGIVLEMEEEKIKERLERRLNRIEEEINRLREERNKIIESLNKKE